MKKRPRPKARAKPPDPLVTQFAEMSKLVMLGASIYYAGTQSAAPPAGPAPEFTFSERTDQAKNTDPLPEV